MTVKPVHNGPVLSWHPVLSDQFSNLRFFAHANAVSVTCVRRLPLLSGRGHPVAVLYLSFDVILPVLSGHHERSNYEIERNNYEMTEWDILL